MSRPIKTGGTRDYFDVIETLMNIEAQRLTAFIPHRGERGRNDEERVRAFFRRVLPKRFKVGSGFIVCSEQKCDPSPQIDIVIYDDTHNVPLYAAYEADVHPIEAVYGFVEVKYSLTKSEKDGLPKIGRDIACVRSMKVHKRYVAYENVEKKPGKSLVRVSDYSIDLAPRSFIFAYTCKGFRTIKDLVSALEAIPDNPHLHGLIVLDKGWFVYQVAFPEKNESLFKFNEDHALMRFYSKMLHDIASVPMAQASIDRYLDFETQG